MNPLENGSTVLCYNCQPRFTFIRLQALYAATAFQLNPCKVNRYCHLKLPLQNKPVSISIGFSYGGQCYKK